jgi:hypothetical protein
MTRPKHAAVPAAAALLVLSGVPSLALAQFEGQRVGVVESWEDPVLDQFGAGFEVGGASAPRTEGNPGMRFWGAWERRWLAGGSFELSAGPLRSVNWDRYTAWGASIGVAGSIPLGHRRVFRWARITHLSLGNRVFFFQGALPVHRGASLRLAGRLEFVRWIEGGTVTPDARIELGVEFWTRRHVRVAYTLGGGDRLYRRRAVTGASIAILGSGRFVDPRIGAAVQLSADFMGSVVGLRGYARIELGAHFPVGRFGYVPFGGGSLGFELRVLALPGMKARTEPTPAPDETLHFRRDGRPRRDAPKYLRPPGGG